MLPTKSTILSPSVHDMCLWAHEPCLGLHTEPCGISRDLPKPPENTSSDPYPKDDAHKGGRPAPVACRWDEQRRAVTHREGRSHPTEGSARRGLANMFTAEGPNGLW